MDFLLEFIKSVVELVILSGVIIGGVFFGRFLRQKKDAKSATETKEQ